MIITKSHDGSMGLVYSYRFAFKKAWKRKNIFPKCRFDGDFPPVQKKSPYINKSKPKNQLSM